jgi:ABC-type lipoprotein export system ATPase subunit
MPDENGGKKNIIECDNLVKIYKTKEVEVVALQGLDLTVEEGELTAIIGKSGSGKTTLLNIIAGLDRPSAGKINVAGKDLLKFNDKQLKEYNRQTIGFVWQNSARNLIPYLTACGNVEIPMLITGKKRRSERARELLAMVGLGNRHNSKLTELSGGELQRVAIAIALANNPTIILADEPTGSIDRKTAFKIMEVFNELNIKLGVTIIIVTHDMKLSSMVRRVVSISDGMIGSEMIRKSDYASRLSKIGEFHSTRESHDEFVVADKKGRIKIPDNILAQFNIEGGQKLKVRQTDKGFEIYRDGDSSGNAEAVK